MAVTRSGCPEIVSALERYHAATLTLAAYKPTKPIIGTRLQKTWYRPSRDDEPPEPKVCIQCGQPLPPQRTGGPRRYCSKHCQYLAYRANHPERPNRFPPKPCERCGTVFTPHGWLTKFCSRECGNANRERLRQERVAAHGSLS